MVGVASKVLEYSQPVSNKFATLSLQKPTFLVYLSIFTKQLPTHSLFYNTSY